MRSWPCSNPSRRGPNSPTPRRQPWDVCCVGASRRTCVTGYTTSPMRGSNLDEAVTGPSPTASVGLVREISVRRLTDSVGIKGSPTISPDGKMVAYTALAGGHRQVFAQLIAGGAPLQVTRETHDHESPRWDADSSRLIYYSSSRSRNDGGSLWEVSAFGGMARRITSAIGGADVSHDGQRLTFFRRGTNRIELMVSARDGSNSRVRLSFPFDRNAYLSPRWSPDDRAIGFARDGMSFETLLFVVTGSTRARPLALPVRPGYAATPGVPTAPDSSTAPRAVTRCRIRRATTSALSISMAPAIGR